MDGIQSDGPASAHAVASTSKACASNTPGRKAILHLQPSVRQTVVKTITTTTIHYAPIELLHPKSPELAGDYTQDRHSLPLLLAEDRRKAALHRAGKSEGDDIEEHSNGQSTREVRRFQLDFPSHSGEPITAVYALDGEGDLANAFCGTSTSDRKGKGKAREITEAPLPNNLQELAPQQAEMKRKRRACVERFPGSPQARMPSGGSDDSSALTPLSTADDDDGARRPRKKRKNTPVSLDSTAGLRGEVGNGLDTPDTTSGDMDERVNPIKLEVSPPSHKGKAKAVAADMGLPSPTLSPRLHQDEFDEAGTGYEGYKSDKHHAPSGVPETNSTGSRAISAVTNQTEQVIEDAVDDSRRNENQLACLSEGYNLSTLMSLPSLVSKYATLNEKLQLNILYQLLRQSSTPVIQKVNHIIQPALKRDFVSDLPAELALHVMSYLTHSPPTIMKCLLVSKNWKRFIDSQGQIWSDLLKHDDLWVGAGIVRDENGAPSTCENAALSVENEEAAYWSSVGVTKSAFNRSRASRSGGRRGQNGRLGRGRDPRTRLLGTEKADGQAVYGSSRSGRRRGQNGRLGRGRDPRTRLLGLEKVEGQAVYSGDDHPKEIDVKDMLSVNDWKSALFLQRWKERTWDESFTVEEAARPTAEKLAAVNNPIQADGVHSNGTLRSASRLRHADTRPSIREYACRTGMTSPPSAAQSLPIEVDYIHPLKLVYKKRVAVRSHWFSPEPAEDSVHRITFRGAQTSVITNLQFDNEKIVTASDDPSIDIYDTMTGELKMRLEGHDGGVWALQYIGNVLVSGSTDRTVRVWDLETGNCTHVFYGHTSTVRCLQIVEPVNVNPDPNGTPVWEPPYPLIVTGSRDWTLRVWRLPYPTRTSSLLPYCPPSPSDEINDPANNAYYLRVLRGHGLAVRALAAHGRTVVSGSYDSYLRVWDLLSGECKHKLVGHSAKVYSVALDAARNRCASGSMDGSVRIWSLETGESLFTLDGHSSLVGLLGCSHHFLVSAGADSTLKVWDPNTGTCINNLAANAGAITCFKHDDFRIVSGCEGQLRVWDIRGGRSVKDVVTNMQGVWQLQFSDRFAVAAVSRDGRTDFEILDFFPELRDDRRHSSEYDDDQDGYDSGNEDVRMQDTFDVHNTALHPPGLVEDDASSSVPHYEVSSSQASMFQTPRQAGSTSSRPPPARNRTEARIYSYPSMVSKQKDHYHHHRQHHHHYHITQAQGSSQMHNSESALGRGHSTTTRQLSNSASIISSVAVVDDPEGVEDLFAYHAGDGSGPSDTTLYQAHTELSDSRQDHQSHLEVGAALADLANSAADTGVKSETPEVKTEEEDVDQKPV